MRLLAALILTCALAGTGHAHIAKDSFGNVLSDTNPALNCYIGFAGGLEDRDTGLVLFGYRDYLPDVGRWTAKDPIGLAGGDLDLYAYCGQDPVNRIDPEGKIAFVPLAWAAIGWLAARPAYTFLGGFVGGFGAAKLQGASNQAAAEFGLGIGTLGMLGTTTLAISRPWLTPCSNPGPGVFGSRGGTVDAGKVGQIKQDMLSGSYRFLDPKGQIGGWHDPATGRYVVSEGHHRAVAAIESGDPANLKALLDLGRWEQGIPSWVTPQPLPPISGN